METSLQIENQYSIEEHFSEKLVAKRIKDLFNEPEAQKVINQGAELLTEFINGEYYQSKMNRLAQLKGMDMHELALAIFERVAFFIKPELYTSATAQLALHLGFSDRREAILTVAELLAVLSETGLFEIYKESKYSSLKIVSNLELDEQLLKDIENCAYVPPMVCKPLTLKHNRSSGYLTDQGSSLILGGAVNHHEGDLCLDVLNTLNSGELSLNTKFLSYLEEDGKEITTESIKEAALKKGKLLSEVEAAERRDLALANWEEFKIQSYENYVLMVKHGNRFHLTHKVDKRGRIYAQGYHITTQGTSFKKAMIDLANQETLEVPEEFKL